MNEQYQYKEQVTEMSRSEANIDNQSQISQQLEMGQQESASFRNQKLNFDNITRLESQRTLDEAHARYQNLQQNEAQNRNSNDLIQSPTQNQYIQAVRDPVKFKQLHKQSVVKWALLKEMDEQKMLAIRVCATIGVVLGFVYSVKPLAENDIKMDKDECFRDYSFIWTQKVNDYLQNNIKLKNHYMIYCGFMMDFIQITSISIFALRYRTLRGATTFAFFMLIRQQIQNHFLMGRPKGFLWFNPGMPALTVPYHDTNDFYYSGHVGTACIYMHEYFANGYKMLGYIALFNMINQWVMLMLLHTHYIIDLVSGLIIATWAIMMGEMFTYLIDVKICGWSGPDRKQTAHDPCHSCGWSNNKISCQINQDEREFLDYTLALRKSLQQEKEANNLKDNEMRKS